MALYLLEDIGSTFDGDLLLNSRGDLKLADSLETFKSAANFVLRTDHGEYAPDPGVGANLGQLIGETMGEEAQEQAEESIFRSLSRNIFSAADIRVTVLPADVDELACFIDLFGTYVVSGEVVDAREEQLTYSFPYITGTMVPLI